MKTHTAYFRAEIALTADIFFADFLLIAERLAAAAKRAKLIRRHKPHKNVQLDYTFSF